MARRRLVAGSAVFAVLALAIAACGGGGDEKPSTEAGGGAPARRSDARPPAQPDPCTLLTSAEVQDALGGPSKPPKRNASPSGGVLRVCTWFREGGAGPRRFVQVSVADFAGGGRAVFDGGKRAAPGANDVDGLGDGAYSSRLGGTTRITALEGDTVISVTSAHGPSARKLVEAVLSRL
jgi:uncharacterized protein DUF3558